jgi:hypothetical protein
MAKGGIIIMKQEELRRLHIIRQVLDKKIKQTEASDKLNLSYRQTKRIAKRIKEYGDRGIVHKSRGQPSHNKIPEGVKNKVIDLCRSRYKGFGPTLAVEKLFEIEKIRMSDETLRHWLIEGGLWQHKRKHKKHRMWRERKSILGEMIQWDGSHHAWFESRGPKCVLIGQIDDATSTKSGQFYEFEGTLPAFASLKQYIKKRGIPHSIYLDKHSTYKSTRKPTIEDELNNREFLSQFERAAKELGIIVIHANSAPAKGRIERSFRTDQDRLIKEMRLADICTIEEANKFLKVYWSTHNSRFSVKPLQEGNLHRPLPQDMDLDAILCRKTEHPLRNDFTIIHDKKLYQILDAQVGKRVTVEEKINGSIYITHNGKRLSYRQITVRPKKEEPKPKQRKMCRPSQEHPWKRPSYENRAVLEKALFQNKNYTEGLALSEA